MTPHSMSFPRKRESKSFVATILIFIACLCVGFWIARHKALWTDEYYSQVSSIHSISYADQFSGRIPEGGNAPLFYSLQKLFLQLIHYQIPAQWLQGHWYSDAPSQILLRINPIIFMSLSVSLVFYYFYRRYSLGIGFMSLFIYISSYMLWVYWAEARPYALIVFLTTVQSLLFLKAVQDRQGFSRIWKWLALVHLLMSSTFIFSVGPILAVSLSLWSMIDRDWRKYLFLTLLPVAVSLFYYVHAPKYQFFFGLSPEQLIRDNISRQRFDILFIFLIFLSVYFWGRKNQRAKVTIGEEILKPVPYIIFMALVLASTAVVLVSFALHAKQGQGFPITSRYFIYLTPIGVIAATILSVSLIKSLNKHRPMQWFLVGLIGLLFAQYFLKIVPGAIHSIMRG
mgnify:CR=1 FL=1